MGCFLGCFGSSKDRKRRKHHRQNKVQPRVQRKEGYSPVQSTVSVVQEYCPEKPIVCPFSEIRDDGPEEKLSLSTRKKVTFNSNVTTYDHVSVEESSDFKLGEEDGDKREEKEENFVKPSQSQSCSEDSSIASSLGSYPPNHRYQNCRDSDDELGYEESDINDSDDEEDDDDGRLDYDDVYEDDEIVESRSRMTNEEIDSDVMIIGLSGKEAKLNRNVRDRSAAVLNPVENLSQWKVVKAKGKPPLRQQKENLTMDQEPRILFSSEPSFKELAFSSKAKADECKKPNKEIAVDASLSNWLGSSECTPVNKPDSVGLDTIAYEKNMSVGSNSPRSFNDRPILGALTVEELKQFSATSSPRRSPSCSPDEIPILGTVGTHWNHSGSGKESGSASSYKGIPNTTSKYREDKRVNWHSTPFETRLERALNGDDARAYSTHTSNVR